MYTFLKAGYSDCFLIMIPTRGHILTNYSITATSLIRYADAPMLFTEVYVQWVDSQRLPVNTGVIGCEVG